MSDYSLDYAISHDAEAQLCTVSFRCFDTPNSVSIQNAAGENDANRVEDLLVQVRRMCLELHRLWSFSLPNSDVSRINDAYAGCEVHDHTACLIAAMKRFHELEPSYDFTIGPVSYLWKHAERVPAREALDEALSHVDANRIAVLGSSVNKADPAMQVDVGGAAKGYAADLIASFLRQAGVSCAYVDLGGNLYMMGKHPEGRPWRVSVRIPDGVGVERIVLELVDEAAVTSGSYERFVQIGDERYQHIIDAATGYPSKSDVVSATVVSSSALQADLLATTTCLLGSQGFESLAARWPSCRFVAITNDARVLRS